MDPLTYLERLLDAAVGAQESHYLANRPGGIVAAYLVAALVFFVLGVYLAGAARDPWRALIALGLAALVMALLRPF